MSAEVLGQAFIDIVARTSDAEQQIKTGLKNAETAAAKSGDSIGRRLSDGFKKAGVAAAAGLAVAGAAAGAFAVHSVHAFTDSVASANGLRRVMGGTIEDASRLAFAAKETGVGTDALATAFRTLETHLTGADKAGKKVVTGYKYIVEQVPGLVDGHIKYHDALKKVALYAPAVATSAVNLGFAYKDAHGHVLPMAELLPKIAEKFHDLPDGAEKTTLAVKLFGRAGLQMLPFLNKGADGLAELTKKSDELGITLSGRDLSAIKQNAQAHKEFHAAIEGLSITVGRLLLPLMAQAATAANAVLLPAITGLSTFIRADLAPVVQTVSGRFQEFIVGLQGGGGATNAFQQMGVVAHDVLQKIEVGIGQAKTAIGEFIAGFAPGKKSFDKRDLIDPAAVTDAESFGQKARDAFDQVYAAVKDHLLPALESLGRNVVTLGGTIASNLLPVVGNLTGLLLSMSGTLIPLAAAFIAVNAAISVSQSIVQTAKDAYDTYKGAIEAATKVKAFFVGTTDAETGAVTASGFATARATVARIANTVSTGVATAATAVFTAAQRALAVATTFLTETVFKGTAAFIATTASKVASAAATVALTVASGVARAATAAWTGAQWLLNAALTANPIGLVVIAIAALVAGMVVAYKNSETFRTIVKGAFDAVATAVGFVVDKLGDAFGLLGHVPGFGWAKTAAAALHNAADAARDLGDRVKGIPEYKHIKVDLAVNGINTLAGVTAKLDRLDGARAAGGPVRAGGAYLVGENGPEMLVPKFDGTIIPAQQTKEMAAGGGHGVVINQQIINPIAEEPSVSANRQMTRLAVLGLVGR